MQITKSYCDRCGKEVKSSMLLLISLTLCGVWATPQNITGDVCKECSDSFKRWFNEKKKKN